VDRGGLARVHIANLRLFEIRCNPHIAGLGYCKHFLSRLQLLSDLYGPVADDAVGRCRDFAVAQIERSLIHHIRDHSGTAWHCRKVRTEL
jgi:hypothetical protein